MGCFCRFGCKIWILVAFLLLTGCGSIYIPHSTHGFPAGTGFTKHHVIVEGTSQTLWVFVPRHYNPQKKYPAVVFLHGLFEAWGGGNGWLSGGLPPVVAQRADDWPFVTIFPQSSGSWRGKDRERDVLAALDYAQEHWSIDSDRVILSGLSFGGQGVWLIGASHPDRFAALVPISGPAAYDDVEKLASLPVWAFDYGGDVLVSSNNSKQMCRRIREHGGDARVTHFFGVGHDCVDLAVNRSDLVEWMLQQHRLDAGATHEGKTAALDLK
jgi:predicted peptidase